MLCAFLNSIKFYEKRFLYYDSMHCPELMAFYLMVSDLLLSTIIIHRLLNSAQCALSDDQPMINKTGKHNWPDNCYVGTHVVGIGIAGIESDQRVQQLEHTPIYLRFFASSKTTG